MNLLPQNLSPVALKANGQTINHVFDKQSISAINAAIAINRPLLIWGEPGIGKSQLARAVAQQLKRVFIPFVCDAHTESRDLLWSFDAVARLAEAQIQGGADPGTRKQALAIENFIKPQALWWGLNWENAKSCADEPPYTEPCNPKNGVVVLIDEIDKADTVVPNGLLEVLGSQRFQPQGMSAVEADTTAASPIVIITTNNERHLPDAFLRRCLSLHLEFPADNETDKDKREKAQTEFLIGRSQKQEYFNDLDPSTIKQAAKMLVEDRQIAKEEHLYPLCGQAEFFDLLRGVKQLSQQQGRPAYELIDELRLYVYQKHPQFPRQAKV
jgi:MoxR-like ATPase